MLDLVYHPLLAIYLGAGSVDLVPAIEARDHAHRIPYFDSGDKEVNKFF